MAHIQLPVNIVTKHMVRPKLDVYYPQIRGLTNLSVLQRMNRKIKSTLQKMIKDQGYGRNPMTEITGYYELKTNERGILSLSLEVYSFSGGAARNHRD